MTPESSIFCRNIRLWFEMAQPSIYFIVGSTTITSQRNFGGRKLYKLSTVCLLKNAVAFNVQRIIVQFSSNLNTLKSGLFLSGLEPMTLAPSVRNVLVRVTGADESGDNDDSLANVHARRQRTLRIILTNFYKQSYDLRMITNGKFYENDTHNNRLQ